MSEVCLSCKCVMSDDEYQDAIQATLDRDLHSEIHDELLPRCEKCLNRILGDWTPDEDYGLEKKAGDYWALVYRDWDEKFWSPAPSGGHYIAIHYRWWVYRCVDHQIDSESDSFGTYTSVVDALAAADAAFDKMRG